MTSTDREILIAIRGEIHAMRVEQVEQGKRIMRIEQRQDRIETRLDEQDARIERIESRLMEYGERLANIDGKIDSLMWGIGIGFGIMGALIALSPLIITAIPFLRSRRENPPIPTPPANDTAPALIHSVIELMRYTREESRKG